MYEYFLQDLAGTVFSSPNAIGVTRDAFNQLGADGWELVGVYGDCAFFKRPIARVIE